MKGDFHVRFCEGLKLECFGLLDRFLNVRLTTRPKPLPLINFGALNFNVTL